MLWASSAAHIDIVCRACCAHCAALHVRARELRWQHAGGPTKKDRVQPPDRCWRRNTNRRSRQGVQYPQPAAYSFGVLVADAMTPRAWSVVSVVVLASGLQCALAGALTWREVVYEAQSDAIPARSNFGMGYDGCVERIHVACGRVLTTRTCHCSSEPATRSSCSVVSLCKNEPAHARTDACAVGDGGLRG